MLQQKGVFDLLTRVTQSEVEILAERKKMGSQKPELPVLIPVVINY